MRTPSIRTLLLLLAPVALIGCQGGSQEATTPSPEPTAQAESPTPPPPGATEHSHEVIEPTVPAAAPQKATAKPAAKPPTTEAAAPSKPAPVEPPPPPPMVELTIPQGMQMAITLDDPLSSATNQIGDVFHAQVAEPIVIGGREAIPAGSVVQGFVEDVKSAAHWDKGGQIVLRFHLVQLPGGEAVPIVASLTAEGKSGTSGKKAAIIGGSAAGGAVLGKVLGKDNKDAVLGTIIGGAIGTGVVAGQKGDEVDLPANTPLYIQVDETFAVSVPA